METLEIQDYVMTAQSRAMNVWAFALTTLLLLTALYFIWKKKLKSCPQRTHPADSNQLCHVVQ